MINWIKKNWKDPVWSKVFAAGILAIFSGLWVIVRSIFSKISISASISDFWKFINKEISVPLWLLFLFVVLVIYYVWILFRKRRRIKPNAPQKIIEAKKKTSIENQEIKQISSSKTIIAKPGLPLTTLNSSFLECKNGIFNIWVFVSDIHNTIQQKCRHMYIVGYATNAGNPLRNPALANYPNAWAISRLTPTPNDNYGIWRFWCNSIENKLTHLDYKEPLSGGWHLFSVSWSNAKEYIKFIIDCKVVSESKFENWPTDISRTMFLGTWPNKAPVHYFDSQIGPWKFFESEYNKDLIYNFYNEKP